MLQSFSVVCSALSDSSATPWTVAHQAPLTMGFLPFPSPGDLLDPGIKHTSPALAGRFLTTELPGKPKTHRNGRGQFL